LWWRNSAVEKWIALLGKRDTPTDGVADYCAFLSEALGRRGVQLEQVRVSWAEDGWSAALRKLEHQAADWRGRWVFMQYTALAWSTRAFPLRALRTVRVLKRSGARVGVMFHEYGHQVGGGSAVIRPVREACQDFVVRRLHALSDLSIFTVPTKKLVWLSAEDAGDAKAVFIPIGANIPEPAGDAHATEIAIGLARNLREGDEKVIAVFSFTPGTRLELEAREIVGAVKAARAAGEKVHLVVFGGGSEAARGAIERGLDGSGARVSILGIIPAQQIADTLAQADVQIFVRGFVEQTRGSALAGIACGAPIVGYAGAAAGTPIEETGVVLVPFRDKEALSAAVVRVLRDGALHEELRRRSLLAQQKYFSWDAIAAKYATACGREATVASAVGAAVDAPVASNVAGNVLK
jgi:glycosyltransferase involved in cell wall biosynthesis